MCQLYPIIGVQIKIAMSVSCLLAVFRRLYSTMYDPKMFPVRVHHVTQTHLTADMVMCFTTS